MKEQCGIVRDLLPIYTEGLTCEESNKMISAHLDQCADCRKTLDRMRTGQVKTTFNTETDQMFQNYVKTRNKKARKKMTLIIAIGIVAAIIIQLLPNILLGVAERSGLSTANVITDEDVSHYSRYIGADAQEKYADKYKMREDIFPEKITSDMDVREYKMVYYEPWDAQWLSYLTVEYKTDKAYESELARLHAYKSTKYLGYYGVKGFDNDYELAAMEADSYNGFVYALDAHDRKIVYVEIIFCNYKMDLYYPDYIPADYLPEGFDATDNNPYYKKNA